MRCAFGRGQLSGMSVLIQQPKADAYKCHAAAFIVGHSTPHDKFGLQDAFQCISMCCATYDNFAHVQLLQYLHNPNTPARLYISVGTYS